MTLKQKKILITGGAGFIGTHLTERLVSECEVVLFDNFRRNSLVPEIENHPKVKVMQGDVLDPRSFQQAMEGVDTVLHLAAIAGVSSYYQEPLKTLRVNVLGTANILEESARRKIKTFVHFSTSEVFGPNANKVDEATPYAIGPVTERRWVYATSKLTGEQFAFRTAEQYGFACAVVRPFNIYGPRQMGEGAVSNFCRAAAQKEPITIYGDGTAIRSWCYISDFVDAIYAILSKHQSGCEAFNIGNPDEVETTTGLANRIVRLEPETQIQTVKTDRTEVQTRIPVIDKARKVLGFEPKVGLDEGLHKTLEWFKCRGKALV
jgi:UDP-glucose 4-epimerase